MIPRYRLGVFWSEPDACWIANVPDLRHCSAHGATPERAVAGVQIAIELFVEDLVASGDPVPSARDLREIGWNARAA